MVIRLAGNTIEIEKNGDQLANFYRCANCKQLIAVGCVLNGVSRGAINPELFSNVSEFGEPIHIQPRLLSAQEKLQRWEALWGVLNIIS